MSSSKSGPKSPSGRFGFRVTRGVTLRAIEDYLCSLSCPRSLTVWLLYKNQEFEQLMDLEFDPDQYHGLDNFRDAYMATEFLSKFEDFSSSSDKERLAIEKFEKYEQLCKTTNNSLRSARGGGFINHPLGPALFSMSYKISKILGELDVSEIFDNSGWGKGASTRVKRREASDPHKFQYEIGITRKLYDLLCPHGSLAILRGYSPSWCQQLVEQGFPLFQGNTIITVPKNSKIDRVIAVEPGLNLWFQKGAGKTIKRKLRAWGVDTKDQGRNQGLSRRGSRDNSLATIDFSSASDSISYELVKELLPENWFELLNHLRTGYGKHDTKSYVWEKFSSMGNGFTFELETLIFFALALFCAEEAGVPSKDISVYGDDVILPSALVPSFRYYSELLGFSFNQKKSHTTSHFRESCGAHWYNGYDIKPVYLKNRLNTVQSVYRLANKVRRLGHRLNGYWGCDSRFRAMFYRLVFTVPKFLRLWIPERFGDGGFIGNLDEACPKRANSKYLSSDYEGWLVRHVVDKSVSSSVEYTGLLISRLRGLDSPRRKVPELLGAFWRMEEIPSLGISLVSLRNSVAIKDRTLPIISVGSIPQWYDLGDWY